MSAPIAEWNEERRSAWLYGQVAQAERDARRRRMFESLREAALRQAGYWEQRARDAGTTLPEPWRPDARSRIVARLVRLLGPRTCRPLLAALKVRGLSAYGPRAQPTGEGHVMPRSLDDFGARHHARGGGNLRAVVFGVNDGLVSNASLILGFAGASAEPRTLVLSGVAGLLAGAFSMAAGEYVSVRSQRELYEYQIGLERKELDAYPDEEAEELALIYSARNVPLEEARRLVRHLMSDRETALDVLAREELGLDPDGLGSPWGAGLWSFVSFALGAALPLLPLFFAEGPNAVLATAIVTAAALFGVGASLTLFTGRNAFFSGMRMLTIGAAAGLATWLLGRLLG